MKPISTSLVHRILPPDTAVPSAYPTLLMLHGRGSDEEDLLGLAESLDDRLFIISARAPYPFPDGGYTWYDVDSIGAPDPKMFENSCRALLTFIDDILSQYPVNPKKLMLFGFSMGSVMSFAMGLSQPQLFRGVVAHSGYLPEGTHLHLRWNELGNTDFFIAHGIADPVIPIALARRAKELFDKSTASVVYREYPMAHQISEESLADASGWISQRISG